MALANDGPTGSTSLPLTMRVFDVARVESTSNRSSPALTTIRCASPIRRASGRTSTHRPRPIGPGRVNRGRHVGAEVVFARRQVANAKLAAFFALREPDRHLCHAAREIGVPQYLHFDSC